MLVETAREEKVSAEIPLAGLFLAIRYFRTRVERQRTLAVWPPLVARKAAAGSRGAATQSLCCAAAGPRIN